MSAGSSYGNGLIKFIEKSFCSNGICNDVTVCQTVDYNGEAKYYVPLRDVEGNRKSKELVINEMHHVNKKNGLRWSRSLEKWRKGKVKSLQRNSFRIPVLEYLPLGKISRNSPYYWRPSI